MAIHWKQKMAKATDILKSLPQSVTSLESPWSGATSITIERWRAPRNGPQPDFRVALRWGKKAFKFAAEAKSRSIPAVLEQACREALRARMLSQRAGLRACAVAKSARCVDSITGSVLQR